MSLGPLIIDVEGFALTAEESERLLQKEEELQKQKLQEILEILLLLN